MLLVLLLGISGHRIRIIHKALVEACGRRSSWVQDSPYLGPRGVQEGLDCGEVVAERRLLALDAHVVGVVACHQGNTTDYFPNMGEEPLNLFRLPCLRHLPGRIQKIEHGRRMIHAWFGSFFLLRVGKL